MLLTLVACARSVEVDECQQLGFAEGLACTSCDKLASLVADEALERDCRGCCQESNVSDSGRFDSGRLEICE